MRLGGGNDIDRGQKLRFSFDGRSFEGYCGDTLASALLAAGQRIFGRSFKYHRPRGVFADGAHEPNALVTIGRGSAQTPNQRATQQEIYQGLEARSQNRWPSLSHDVMAVNDLFSQFLGAGFYYKTFMWPRAAWKKLYEPLIRRAAGLGALSGKAERAPHEKAWAFCDLLIIGAGPAGLVAALQAARAGADVILAEEKPFLGGQLRGESEVIGGAPAIEWIAQVEAELLQMDNVRILRRTTVTGVYDQGTYGALERTALHLARPGDAPRESFWRIVARRALVCTGAHERLVAFPGNDVPGVMLAGAVRGYLHRFGVGCGKRIAIFCNNDDAHRTARDLAQAGLEIAALIDSRPDAGLSGDFPLFAGGLVQRTYGRKGLRAVLVKHGGKTVRIEADCLAVSGGWNPALHLSCHLGAKPVWNPAIAAFVPHSDAAPGLDVAGAAAGVFTTKGAMKSGVYRAKLMLESLGLKAPRYTPPEAEDAQPDLAPLWHVRARGRAWLDLQNDVTVKDVHIAVRENYSSAEHMKRYTTLGMAPDQGKTGAVAAMAVLADATGRNIADVGITTYRPPYSPITIAAMGSDGLGRRFAPERVSAADAVCREKGAPMAETGLWFRPLCFARPGEGRWRQSCDREVQMVRSKVGACDVSTLGKIEIFGADAAQFLDFVYTNRMSNLAVGRMRYGLMLREDGFVMDDGTCARLGRRHFLLTTTTGAADEVLSHLEFAHQCLRPDMDVHILPVTDQWAQFAFAGPLAFDLVKNLVQGNSVKEKMPFMHWRQVAVSGVESRLFRVSFSGELGFELAVPAAIGESLFRVAVALAEGMGGGAYGLEAMNVLRLEKGFLTHAEIDGRTTADDLGLGHMLSPHKDFIGKAMASRPALRASGRAQLVGLKPVGAVKLLSGGASLFGPADAPTHENIQGHCTSAAYCPSLGRVHALALLKEGRSRHGDRIRLLDRLRGLDAICEIGPPAAYDPHGERMRG